MIRRALVSVAALALAVLVVVPHASGATPDEVKCEVQKIKAAGKQAKTEVMKCFKDAAQLNADPTECIAEAKAKLEKKMTAIEAKLTNCPTVIDIDRSKRLIDLYSQRIADASASNYSELTCAFGCYDEWTFSVDSGEVVRAVADGTTEDEGSDLMITITCDGSADNLTADNEQPCTYPPANDSGCPDGSFTSTASQTCNAEVWIASTGGCQAAVAPYRLRITTSGHTPLNLIKITSDSCP